MDIFNMNLDMHYILTEYSIHIFICVIIGFGSLIYCLSIRSPDSVFESPKLSKKKPKKEKQSRIKNVKPVSQKIEPKIDVNIVTEHNIEIAEEVQDFIDDDGSTNWQPVIKPKKVPKTDKIKSVNKPQAKPQNKDDCNKVQPIVITKSKTEKPIVEIKTDIKPAVIETICDNSTEQPKEIKQPQPKITPTIERKIENPIIAAIEETRILADSPTNSLSDDFEIVEAYKTSSEDGLKLEFEPSAEAVTSSTSGASRKKNKKQQKLISKQLIEAAKIETENDQRKNESVSNETARPLSTAAMKKKRPRKDV